VRIIVNDISSLGKHVRFSEADAWAVSAARDAVEGDVSDLKGHLHLERGTRRAVKVTATGSLRASRLCDRCGCEVVISVQADEVLRYLPEGEECQEEERELSASDLDIGWYRDGAVDVSDVVSELYALALPARVLCEDTKCGQAEGSAETQATTGHPAFAALKEIF
jgi:uncharacterized metal-binding protein YceD (DUF177 family)